MPVTNQKVKRLLELYREISLLQTIEATLGWDLNVNLPSNASPTRAEQSAYLTQLMTEKWQSEELNSLVADLLDTKSLTIEEKAIVRNTNHALKYYSHIPKELIVEFSKTTSEAFMAWNKARQENNFSDFLPHLKSIIRLNQLFAKHLGYQNNPYDALLDLYEPGLTAARAEELFNEIKDPLQELIQKVMKSKKYIKDFDLVGENKVYDTKRQEELSIFILKKMGYLFDSGRIDVSPHPFTIGLGQNDIRITTAYKPTDFRESLTASIHEGGHALYEQGINPEFAHSPLAGGVSLGIHESQSRFWENQIGRSPEFISFITPLIHAFFPDTSKTDSDKLTLFFNHVRPSFIRIEADEVTYNMHIILRFELENDLINGKLDPENLPEAWNNKMKKYLGIVPPTDREGVLQDVHWAYGSLGYFPTYTLGNLYAGQIRWAMLKEIPYEKELARGNFGPVLAWLREHIHQFGSVYWPEELIKHATGKKLSSQFYLDYITDKYTRLYQLS